MTALRWHPVENLLVVGCENDSVYVWDIETGDGSEAAPVRPFSSSAAVRPGGGGVVVSLGASCSDEQERNRWTLIGPLFFLLQFLFVIIRGSKIGPE